MGNIIAFAGSTSKYSINLKLVRYAVSELKRNRAEILDLNDYQLPIFSVDKEKSDGYPQNAINFNNKIVESSGIILSLAEHNGSYTAAFKNLFDWLSRIESKVWRNKPMLLMSASPGARGGKGVLDAATTRFPFHNSDITGVFSLPHFKDNFSNVGITNIDLNRELKAALEQFENALDNV